MTEVAHSRDYFERTIETVRIHRDADNSWPQWANVFADEIERLWGLEEQLVTLIRIGFLVRVNGERAEADIVENPEMRALLFSILQAKDTAAAVASLP